MKILGVIPARYASTRFPGKPLALINGRPMIQHVFERAAACASLDRVIVATDDERIAACVSGFGGEVMLTRADHASGTDRLGEVAERVPDYGYLVNLQGDEPLLDAAAIDELAAQTLAARAPMSTLVHRLAFDADGDVIVDVNVVKVAVSDFRQALYFSRAAIPYARRPEHARYFKHIGIYMYSVDTLLALCSLAPSPLELAESLEQLRALENGIPILAVETAYDPIGVDTPADIPAVEARLSGQ